MTQKERSSKHYKKNREKILARTRTWKIQKHYGITQEEYDICMSTSNCCEVCGSPKALCYDHDHDTMKFRGVLCNKCNRAIGQLGDNEEGVLAAYEYLRREHNEFS